ncbi:hypothetical protein BpHYR1_013372 [Brachionus plicatilis]|uniref:Uncharacterized protein n=1 Tax=Brachionus plicatilis TaxID=10195 RepID=A0A3M7SZG4_BRAPC|nr:hypothetical protein BpHYR1_013372 [Brachionus plicatilis]
MIITENYKNEESQKIFTPPMLNFDLQQDFKVDYLNSLWAFTCYAMRILCKDSSVKLCLKCKITAFTRIDGKDLFKVSCYLIR